ncbi:MAG: hypothetical protein K6T31_08590, partial [Alicyclobacillus sp.]|nr:hypothetical protein [Alicyclobacillus sp.]
MPEHDETQADTRGPAAALAEAFPVPLAGPAGAEQWHGSAASTGEGRELPATWQARLPAWSQRVQPPRWLPDLPARLRGRPGANVLLDVRRTVRRWA